MLVAASDCHHLTHHLTGTRRLLHYAGLLSCARLKMQQLSCPQLTASTWSRPMAQHVHLQDLKGARAAGSSDSLGQLVAGTHS